MRDINRIPRVLELLKEIWLRHPDLRFYQLLEWIHGCPKDFGDGCFRGYEDDDMEEEMEAFNDRDRGYNSEVE